MENTNQNSQPQPTANQPKKKNIGMAVIAYIIFFIPLITEAKDDPFVKYHVKQGLVLFIFAVIAWFVSSVIPVIGWFILSPLSNLAILVFMIIGIINAANGVEKPLPFIGSFSDKLKF